MTKTDTVRKQINAHVAADAHKQWRTAADVAGVTITALVQAVAPALGATIDRQPWIVVEARAIDAARRLRPNSGRNQHTETPA